MSFDGHTSSFNNSYFCYRFLPRDLMLPSFTQNEYCEINEGLDYLQYEGQVDITLSNPPFVPRKLFWAFHEKAMATTTREIWWLINMSALNVFTPKRLREIEAQGWYFNQMVVVSDKRWFGRYVWVKFSRFNNHTLLIGKNY